MESTNNTTLPFTIITDATGGLWGIACATVTNAGQVIKNGVIDGGTYNVVLLLYSGHTVYHKNTSGNFYRYTNPGWVQTADPRIAVESANGTAITTAGPSIIDATLEAWTLVQSATASVGLQIATNGVIDSVTNNVVLLLYENHLVYQENSGGGWWYKSKSSDSWTLSSDPRVPPVTSTVTHYGTTAPITAPTGWTVGAFEDFLSFNPSSTTPYATTNENPAAKWFLGIGGYGTNGSYGYTEGGSSEAYFCSPGLNGINPFSQSGSILTITASVPTSAQAAKMGGTYIAGALSATFLAQCTSGYFEMNAKLPPGVGMWSAFWLTASNTWPPEYDILEQVGSQPNVVTTTNHYGSSNAYSGSGNYNVGVDTTAGFHTYGGLWTPTYTATYFDGKLIHFNPNGFSGAQSLNGSFVMFPIINLGMGNFGGGTVQPSELPVALQIDWFRYSLLGPQ
jgi:hypothetical protein